MTQKVVRKMPESWPRQKDVQIIIHGHAEYDSNDDIKAIDFDDFVNKSFNDNRKKLEELFAGKSFSYKSALKGLQFDSVEKQIR